MHRDPHAQTRAGVEAQIEAVEIRAHMHSFLPLVVPADLGGRAEHPRLPLRQGSELVEGLGA